ncbi:hypothetical protein [Georgenia alba]|uniref:Uncharacterized protein n=1 Tax=Georgenia alba TaxID=2233858 RepID=A0ABW2Q728_9MICO
MRPAVLTGVVAVVVVAGVLAWMRPWEELADAGDVVAVPANLVTGEPTELLLPLAGLRVVVGDPVTVAPDHWIGDGDAEDRPPPPPRGGSYLPVSIETFMPQTLHATLLPGADQVEPGLVVEAAGTRFDLTDELERSFGADGTLVLEERGFYLAVDDEPDGAAITVSFDGESQTLRPDGTLEDGRFAVLGEPAPARQHDCGPPTLPDGVHVDPSLPPDGRYTCRVSTPATLPWVGGLGWAPEGSTWLVLSLVLEPAWRLRGPGGVELHPQIGAEDEPPPTVTVGGTEATNVHRLNDAAGTHTIRHVDDPWRAVHLVREDAPMPELSVTYPTPFADPSLDVPATWTLDLETR